ncbi:hypothetical protein CRENBAI_007262 [Crenichthys baileyi]|uniref:Uncharacterized protein n=1 Tax=Crenichthys baileyi TaxID=28760 RepID=A0AAV9RG24_9TELE
MTEDSSQYLDQAHRSAAEALRWIQQQLEEAEHRNKDVEILPSPLLLEEMQQAFRGSRLVIALPGMVKRTLVAQSQLAVGSLARTFSAMVSKVPQRSPLAFLQSLRD